MAVLYVCEGILIFCIIRTPLIMHPIYRIGTEKLETVSCTDSAMEWKKMAVSKQSEYAPCKLEQLCHVPAVGKPSQGKVRGAAFTDLIQAAPGSSVARNLREPPPATESVEVEDTVVCIKSVIEHTMQGQSVVDVPVGSPQSFDSVRVTAAKAVEIACLPQGSPQWTKERAVRVTASQCHELYTYSHNMRPDWEKKLKAMEWAKQFTGNAATRYGHQSESAALAMYETLTVNDEHHYILRCGLIVPPQCPWIGCSPDAILMVHGKPEKLVEVKSPVCGKKLCVQEMLQSRAIDFLTYDQENVCSLKRRHKYFSQVQLGMAILGVGMCDFVVRGKDSIVVIPVVRDQSYIDMLLRSLHATYFSILLPRWLSNV